MLSVVHGSGVCVRTVEDSGLELGWTVAPGVVLGLLCSGSLRGLYVGSIGGSCGSVQVLGRQWYWEVSGLESRLGNWVRLSTVSQPLYVRSGAVG